MFRAAKPNEDDAKSVHRGAKIRIISEKPHPAADYPTSVRSSSRRRVAETGLLR